MRQARAAQKGAVGLGMLALVALLGSAFHSDGRFPEAYYRESYRQYRHCTAMRPTRVANYALQAGVRNLPVDTSAGALARIRVQAQMERQLAESLRLCAELPSPGSLHPDGVASP